MIKLYGDYHTHTIYSHGKGTIMDNVLAAQKKGLTEIAITDHGISHFTFGVKMRDLRKMRDEIDRINDEVDGIKVLLGMECNIISINGDVDINDEVLKYTDIILMGYHMMVMPKSIKDFFSIYGKNYSARLVPSISERVRFDNTVAMIKALRKYKIDIITHPGARIPIDTTEVAKEAVKHGTAMEINSHSGFLTVDAVRSAAEVGAKFVINSDAHSPEAVGNLDKGIRIAMEAGLDSSKIINAV